MGISDESLFMQSIKEIENLDNPYYMFIITLSSHMPFSISEDIRYLDMPYNDYSCNYIQSIHYTDKVLGEFYNKLKSKGYLENSILIVYGDHQGVHKYYDTYLPDNEGKLPFIIHIPGINGFENDKIGGQVDMMPTLLYLLGIEGNNSSNYMMGKNLFLDMPGSALLPNGEIIGQPHNKEHLYSAQKIADLIIKGNYFNLK
jgi:phosphoglycerol transferase MdoB-like AlkP superfamily enzyme